MKNQIEWKNWRKEGVKWYYRGVEEVRLCFCSPTLLHVGDWELSEIQYKNYYNKETFGEHDANGLVSSKLIDLQLKMTEI